MSITDRTALARSYFESKGWTPEQASGIVGNFRGESGLNPNAYNPADPGGSYGIGQWNGPRYNALRSFAMARGAPWNDLQTQLAFAQNELDTTEKRAADRLRSAQDVPSATTSFYRGYERGDPSQAHMDRRMQYAQDAYGIPGTGASGMIASGMPIATGFTNPSMVGAMPGTYSQSPNPDMYAQNLGNWINAPVGAPMAAAASPTPQTGAVGPIATAAKWVMDRVNQARQGLGGLAAIGGLAPRPYSGGQLESIRSGISPSTFQGNQRFSHAGEH